MCNYNVLILWWSECLVQCQFYRRFRTMLKEVVVYTESHGKIQSLVLILSLICHICGAYSMQLRCLTTTFYLERPDRPICKTVRALYMLIDRGQKTYYVIVSNNFSLGTTAISLPFDCFQLVCSITNHRCLCVEIRYLEDQRVFTTEIYRLIRLPLFEVKDACFRFSPGLRCYFDNARSIFCYSCHCLHYIS